MMNWGEKLGKIIFTKKTKNSIYKIKNTQIISISMEKSMSIRKRKLLAMREKMRKFFEIL